MLAAGTASAVADRYTWIGGGAGTWDLAANWTGSTGLPGSADEVVFNISTAVTLDSNPTVAIWRNGWQEGTSAVTGHVTLVTGTGNTLNIGDGMTDGLIVSGGATNGGGVGGDLYLSTGVTLNLHGGAYYIGTDFVDGATSRNKARSGALNLSQGSVLNLGSAVRRSQWVIGRMNTNGTAGEYPAIAYRGVVQARTVSGGGHLSAYLSDFTIGTSTGAPYWITRHAGEGVVDLTGVETAHIDADRIVVGRGDNASATGSLKLGNGVAASQDFRVNESLKIGTGGVSSALVVLEPDNNIAGTLEWGTGSSVTLGSSGQPITLEIGVSSVTRGTNITVTGSAKGTGGSFSAHLSTLTIGSQNGTTSGKTYLTSGELDLRDTEVLHFSASQDVHIGVGDGNGSQGILRLANAAAHFGQNLTIGDTKAGSSGLVELTGSVIHIDGNVLLNESGRVEVVVAGGSSGLFLSEGSSFSTALPESEVANYSITFSGFGEAPGIYYGLAWGGDQTTPLNTLIGEEKITWTNLTSLDTIGVFYDFTTNATYLGVTVIPEPTTYALLLSTLGAVAILRRRKRALSSHH